MNQCQKQGFHYCPNCDNQIPIRGSHTVLSKHIAFLTELCDDLDHGRLYVEDFDSELIQRLAMAFSVADKP